MPENKRNFVISMERFKPHSFQAEQGEGLFISHSHEFDELTLIMEGEGYYSSPEQNIKVAKGDLILIPSQLHHGFVCTEAWQGISIHFYHDKLPLYCQYLFRDVEVEPDTIRRAHLNDEEMQWVEISFRHLEKEWQANSQSLDAQQLMRVAFETALLLFQRNRSNAPNTEKTDMATIKNVIKEIHNSFYTQITVNEIAARHFIKQPRILVTSVMEMNRLRLKHRFSYANQTTYVKINVVTDSL